MRNDVILFPSRLANAEKDSSLHSQTLPATPADGAAWSVAHFAHAGVSSSMIQTLGGEEGLGRGRISPC